MASRPNPKQALVALRDTLMAPSFAQSISAGVPQTLAKYLTAERVTRIVLSAASRNPTLLQCTPVSIAKSCAECVRLGLEPMSPLGHAYLVPYRNKDTGYEAQAIIGYRGYLELARRSGKITSIVSQIVYKNDDFSIDLAGGERPHHVPHFGEERGIAIAVYCIADFAAGGYYVDAMSMHEVEAIRKRSKAGNSGPWVTDFGEMARKTIVRRAAKYWPLSTEMADAMSLDDGAPPVWDAAEPLTPAPVVDDEPSAMSSLSALIGVESDAGAPAERGVT